MALARRGKTVILSSHLLADVEDVCDRVVIYYGGRIQAMGTLKELLAKPDTVRITMPPLPREAMQRVLALIRTDVSEDKVRIDNPTQNLESYFLEVVQKAKQSAAETSGATAGNRVAAYLRGDAEAQPAADKILERLTLPSTPAPEEKPVAVAPADLVDRAKLETLTQSVTHASPLPTAPMSTPAAANTADLEKANAKLSSLLGETKEPASGNAGRSKP